MVWLIGPENMIKLQVLFLVVLCLLPKPFQKWHLQREEKIWH